MAEVGDPVLRSPTVRLEGISLTDVVPGLTIDLTSVSDDPVTVTIARDTDAIVETFQTYYSDAAASEERADFDADVEKETSREDRTG